ncbi:flavin monoamine oxidase family protein [Paenibacillus woosongensis]|nr:FAD-dependent oxidoreductase [Paenibacillus woosongensis]
MKKHESVVIVGGGLSGMRTASLLSAKGIPCRVLEARDRIGGRVLSQEVIGRPDLGKFDLGPTWFWPRYEHAITGLVHELGLKTFLQYQTGLMVTERSHKEPPQQYALPEGAMESAVRLAGGVQALVDAIAATLPEGIIQLNTRVSSVSENGDGNLVIEVDGGKEEIRARAVIITVPPRLAARNIIFRPELAPDLMISLLNKPTWMASHAKVIAVYKRPFWREQGLSGFATSWAGPLQEIHDASPVTGVGALFGFFGISAKRREELGEERIMKLVKEQLIRLFGPLAGHTLALLYKDWSNDPATAVTEDAQPLQDYPNYGPPVGMQSWDKKIFFAGTETAPTQGGHLEGALRSAERAVSELMEHFQSNESHL